MFIAVMVGTVCDAVAYKITVKCRYNNAAYSAVHKT
jgi:hypothetical protein